MMKLFQCTVCSWKTALMTPPGFTGATNIFCDQCVCGQTFGLVPESVGLRDTLAMAALGGMLAGISWRAGLFVHCDEMANDAYGFADAMLKERERKPDQSL